MKTFDNNDVVRKLSGEKPVESLAMQSVHPIAWAGPALSEYGELYDFRMLDVVNLWRHYGVRGEGVDVFVIDSGAEDHPCLRHHKDIDKRSFVTGQDVVKDGTGHGTWVSSKIAGAGIGIAPKCRLHVYQSLDEGGTGSATFSVKALKAVYSVASPYKIVNMSLGSFTRSREQDAVLRELADQGTLVVCAAGNFGSSEPFFPAASDNTLAVAAYDGTSTRADFSNYGDYVDISAPGVGCYGAFLGGMFRKMSGTSMATPIVSGVLTLGLSLLARKKIVRRRDDVLQDFIGSLLDLGERGKDPLYGFGALNPWKFLEKLDA